MTILDPIGAFIEALTPGQLEALAGRLAPFMPRAEQHPTRPSPYGSIPEVAAHLRTSRQRIDTLLSEGKLTRVKEGGRTLIAWEEVERHLDGEKTGPLAEAAARARARDAA